MLVKGINNEIQYQEVMQLKEIHRSTSQVNSKILATTSMKNATISMPKTFNGTNSKYQWFSQQNKLYLSLHLFSYLNKFIQIRFLDVLLCGGHFFYFGPSTKKIRDSYTI